MTVDTITKNARLDPDWRESAACRECPELFHPTSGEDKKAEVAKAEAAKAVCRRCPVIESCEVWAEAYEGDKSEYHTIGILAGMSANERNRRRLLRRQAAA